MATNKHAQIRYKILDNCFRNPGRRYFINDLISECEKVLMDIDPESKGISRRQILSDIEFMESSEGWSIELVRYRDKKRVYYRYADLRFSINNMPLNEMEINQLKAALQTLSQFKGLIQFDVVNELIPKLGQKVQIANDDKVFMEFEKNQFLKGIEFLGAFINAIYYKKVLKISYQPFENEFPILVVFHPYYLKQYNGRWFVFGYNSENERYDWNLAIDRIVDFTEYDSQFKKNTEIDWNEYFEDLIGVTKPINSKSEVVIFHVFGRTINYVKTKPIHGSQKVNMISDDVLEVKIDVIINMELENLLLSFGDNLKIIEPKHLSDKIRGRLINALNRY